MITILEIDSKLLSLLNYLSKNVDIPFDLSFQILSEISLHFNTIFRSN